MKREDFFTNEDFLTVENPNSFEGDQLTSADKKMLEEIALTSSPDYSEAPTSFNDIPELHRSEQLSSSRAKRQIAEDYDKSIPTEERAVMGAESMQKDRQFKLPTARDLFKDVINLTNYSEEVKMYRHVWTLRGLDHSDILAAADEVRDTAQGNVGFLTSFTFSKLVYSIEAVDHITIFEIFRDIDKTKFGKEIDYIMAVKRALRAYLLAMPDLVIDDLITAYTEMELRRNQEIIKLKNL